MNIGIFMKTAVTATLLAMICGTAHAGNIDAADKYAWGTNVGWVNFNSANSSGGVTVCDDHLEGYVWAENIGWISLGTYTGGGTHTYANTDDTNYGVNNTTAGVLSGYAWSTNAGWINFNPTGGGVTIDSSGNFNGYAWGENIGWIHFQNASPAYKVAISTTPAYILTVNTAGTGSGTVSGGGSYTSGVAVVLTATPDAGSVFTGWSPSPCAASFAMPGSALTCTATFNLLSVPPAGLPDAPSGLTAHPVSHDAVHLKWKDNSDNETGFIIERWSLGSDWTAVAVVGADVTSYRDSSLSYSWEYHYRIRAYNEDGNSDYSNETSAITWFRPYNTCKGVTLNGSETLQGSASVQENAPAGILIGTLGTVAPTGSHRYEVSGADQRFFIIEGDALKTSPSAKPDYEEKKEFRISVKSVDTAASYAWCSSEFVITVTDVPEAPTFLHLSNYVGSVPENQPGSYVADIITEDDPGDTHTYSLVSGEGDTDNALFRIEGNTLKTGPGIDYETKPNLSIRVRTTDQTGAYFERFIVLTVRNTPDPPVLSDIAHIKTDDDVPVSVKFTASDPDTGYEWLRLSVKSESPAVLPDANISLSGTGAERTVTLTPVKGRPGTAKISVTVTDGDFTVEKSFKLTVSKGPGLRAVTHIDSGTDGTPVAGDTLQYSASITNDGDRDVSGVVFTVPLPEGTAYAGSGKRSDSGIAYDSESNEVEWTGDIPEGESVEVTFGVRVTSGGSITFSDAEIAYDSDGDGVNDAVRKAENETNADLSVKDCMPGDVNADGDIGLSDAVLVLQMLSGSDAEICSDADVSNDGQIGVAEAVFILNALSK